MSFCQNTGTSIFGITEGNTCLYSNELGTMFQQETADDCATPCGGNPCEMSGGQGYVLAFKLIESVSRRELPGPAREAVGLQTRQMASASRSLLGKSEIPF